MNEKGILATLLHGYLFFRVPLVRPTRALRAAYPLIKWMYGPTFLLLTILAGVAGIILLFPVWPEFAAYAPKLLTPFGLAVLGVTFMFAKFAHELGHAFTAIRHGCRVGTMDVAFLVMWPVLYTDATEMWKLKSHRDRLRISTAGMSVEIMIACWALLFSHLTDPGILRDALFILAVVTWITSLLINVSPFLRFDGYYILSDFLGLANLQPRSFAMARWRLRELLFNLGDPPPEKFDPSLQRWLVFYAYFTWIYRFFLFLGIAILVYAHFFKVLGMFLMAVEIVWFIARPIYNEFKSWWGMRRRVGHMRLFIIAALFSTAMILVFLIPWPRSISAPAVLNVADETEILASGSGQLRRWNISLGQTISENENLAEIHSAELAKEIRSTRRNIELAEQRLADANVNPNLRDQYLVFKDHISTLNAKLAELFEEQRHLKIKSPRTGKMIFVDSTMHKGAWIGRGTLLGIIGNPGAAIVEAMFGGPDISKIETGRTAKFYTTGNPAAGVPCRIGLIAQQGEVNLPWPVLADVHGGPIVTRQASATEIGLKTIEPYYAVSCVPAKQFEPIQVNHQQTGWLTISLPSIRLADQIIRFVRASILEELAF